MPQEERILFPNICGTVCGGLSKENIYMLLEEVNYLPLRRYLLNLLKIMDGFKIDKLTLVSEVKERT